MTASRRGVAVAIGALGGSICLIVGLVPVVFLDWGRRGGSIGKLSTLGLLLNDLRILKAVTCDDADDTRPRYVRRMAERCDAGC